MGIASLSYGEFGYLCCCFKVRLIVADDAGNILVKRAKAAVAPGEMESLELSAEILTDLAGRGVKEIQLYLEEANA